MKINRVSITERKVTGLKQNQTAMLKKPTPKKSESNEEEFFQ